MHALSILIASILLHAMAIDVCAGNHVADCSSFQGRNFAIYALSKGNGVPTDAFEAYQAAKSRLYDAETRALVARISEVRIGIEGERKLCVEFTNDGDARRLWTELCEKHADIPLLNIQSEICEMK